MSRATTLREAPPIGGGASVYLAKFADGITTWFASPCPDGYVNSLKLVEPDSDEYRRVMPDVLSTLFATMKRTEDRGTAADAAPEHREEYRELSALYYQMTADWVAALETHASEPQ